MIALIDLDPGNISFSIQLATLFLLVLRLQFVGGPVNDKNLKWHGFSIIEPWLLVGSSKANMFETQEMDDAFVYNLGNLYNQGCDYSFHRYNVAFKRLTFQEAVYGPHKSRHV